MQGHNQNCRIWNSQVCRSWPRDISCRRPCHAVQRCQARAQVVSPQTGGSLPTFSFRVTAKQAAATKLRLDTFLAANIAADLAAAPSSLQDVSRAKIQASIAAGLVLINGRPAGKASLQLKPGDIIVCSLPPPPPVQAVPEPIPLDVRYEDEHLLVVNKPAGMVVHVAPGHHTGTLVNAVLHRCAMPALDLDPAAPGGVATAAGSSHAATGVSTGVTGGGEDDDEDLNLNLDLDLDLYPDEGVEDEAGGAVAGSTVGSGAAQQLLRHGSGLGSSSLEVGSGGSSSNSSRSRSSNSSVHRMGSCFSGNDVGTSGSRGGSGGSGSSGGILRPGIVHRLDKGTSGLLVVAKTEVALTRLQAQFKARTVDRLYVSITVGCPAQQQGRVETNVVRDPRDRKRMAAAPYGSGRGRTAASGYVVEQALAGGGAAVVRWKLDTGRTHQIRVHAKHIGHPLLGDETYGGAGPAAVAAVARSYPGDQVRACLEQLGRPALHALTLGFDHPVTGQRLAFEQQPPEDFRRAVRQLDGGP